MQAGAAGAQAGRLLCQSFCLPDLQQLQPSPDLQPMTCPNYVGAHHYLEDKTGEAWLWLCHLSGIGTLCVL